MNNKIIIALSKKKALISLIMSTLFFSAGWLAIFFPERLVSFFFRNPDIIRIIGFAAVCLFGGACFFIYRKLTDNKSGLIIDQYGITDNTNATSIGLIEWNDITGIETRQVMSSKFLIIHTNNPEKYLNRAKNIISKKAMLLNNKTYGSPLSIISNSLKIDFNELETLILSEWNSKKEKSNPETKLDNLS